MDTIVYRDGIPCKLVKDGYRVTVWESKTHGTDLPSGKGDGSTIDLSVLRGPVGGWQGTGQREVRVSRRLLCIPQSEERHLFDACDPFTGEDFKWDLTIDLADLEKKAERCRKKSQQRAKRNCRYKIKHGGFRHMYTGTYRENQTDFDRMRKDYAAWLRKVRAVVPRFRSVWAFEPQKRGAWHFHAVAHTLPRYLRYKGVWKPSYEVLTLLWQDVVGDVQYAFCGPLQPGVQWPVAMVKGGTVNVDGYTKKNKKKMHADARGFSLAKMASYVSKYLTKDLAQGLAGRQMWGSTENLTPPKRISFDLPESALADILAACFEVPSGHRVARHWLNGFGDCWVLDTEPDPTLLGSHLQKP
jgi:hypothetical protein